jgi:hypothetical protein
MLWFAAFLVFTLGVFIGIAMAMRWRPELNDEGPGP